MIQFWLPLMPCVCLSTCSGCMNSGSGVCSSNCPGCMIFGGGLFSSNCSACMNFEGDVGCWPMHDLKLKCNGKMDVDSIPYTSLDSIPYTSLHYSLRGSEDHSHKLWHIFKYRTLPYSSRTPNFNHILLNPAPSCTPKLNVFGPYCSHPAGLVALFSTN